MRTRAVPAALLVGVVALAAPAAARGGLFASFNYYHGLSVSQDGIPPAVAGGMLSGSAASLPLHQTLTGSLPSISASATYAFTDDGTTATYRIDCQTQITRLYCEAGEGSSSPSELVDSFTLASPATYVASFTDVNGGTDLQFQSPDIALVFQLGGTGTMTRTGLIPAGQEVGILENWQLGNSLSTGPAVVSGTESLSIVFTAVPEPASAAGVAVIGAALLARRRRPAGRR